MVTLTQLEFYQRDDKNYRNTRRRLSIDINEYSQFLPFINSSNYEDALSIGGIKYGNPNEFSKLTSTNISIFHRNEPNVSYT